MTKRFIKIGYGDGYAIRDNQTNGLPQIRLQYSDEACFLCDFLNKQEESIKELENEKEVWKSSWGVTFSENNILNNELDIAIEQGYQVTDAFKEYRKRRQ